jgi:hypothetical protein
MLRIESNFVHDVAHHSSANSGAVDPGRDSPAELRLGRDLSQLKAHRLLQETELQYAATKVARLTARPHHDGEGPAGTVDQGSLKDYVRASLGMKHDADKIDPGLHQVRDEMIPLEWR